MVTTNFLQFNPTQNNQENDTAYAADTVRTGGAGIDGIWPSDSANKTLYQASTFNAAMAQMLLNKGFSTSDASLSTLAGVLANILTTADVPLKVQQLTYAPALTLNVSAYAAFEIVLSGNCAITLSNRQAGQLILISYIQDNTTTQHLVSVNGGAVGGLCQPATYPNALSGQYFFIDAALFPHAIGPLISTFGIDNTPIGYQNPSTGVFTTLAVTLGATVAANLTAGSLSSNGNVTATGSFNTTVGNFQTSSGSAIAANLSISNNATVSGTLTANVLTSNNNVNASGYVIAPNATISGTATVGTLAATTETVSGTATIGTMAATTAATAPTVSSGDNSTNVITSAWAKVGFASSLVSNGYFKFPTWLGGLMIQWGTAGGLGNNTPTTVSFNTAWPNACFAVVANDNSSFATGGNPRTMGCTITSTTQFTIEASGSGASAFWIAVGH